MQIRTLAMATSLCIASAVIAGEPSQAAGVARMDLTRCLSHVERSSQAAMMRQPWAEDAAYAMRCHPQHYEHLPPEQLEHLRTIYQLFQIQTEAPSATVHSELLREMQDFMRGIR